MKIRCLLSVIPFCFLVQFICAQPPAIEWQKSYGGSGRDIAQAMDETTDCGYIIAGFSNSTDGDVTSPHGNDDFWLCKLKHDGGIEWQKTYGGTSREIAYSVKQTRDGGFIAVGFTLSNDGDVVGFHSGVQFGSITPDLWVIKTDAAGQLQWQRSLGGKGREVGYSVQLTSDGGYIITGEANESDGDVSGYHTGTLFDNTPDVWVVKLSAGGFIEWQKCYGSFLNELGRAIKPTSDGGFIVTGYVQTPSPDTGDVKGIHNPPSGAVFADVWVLKLSSLGAIEWQKCLGGFSGDDGYDIIESRNGGFVVLATTNSVDGDVIGGSAGNTLMWLVKLTGNGNISWQQTYNVQNPIRPCNVTEDERGGFTIGASRFFFAGTQEYLDYGMANYLLLKTDSTGKPVWEKVLGGPSEDQCNMALPTKDNGYILCGYALANGNDVTGNHGLGDYWVVKLKSQSMLTITASAQKTCMGVPVVFTASLTNSTGTVSYQWLLNGKVLGVDSNQITMTSLRDSDKISCVSTSTNSCYQNKDTSNSIVMVISDEVPPTISISANSTRICFGDSSLFNATVTNIGINTTYQWLVNGSNFGNNGPQLMSNTLRNNDTVSCILTTTGTCGTNQRVFSNPIVIKVSELVQTGVRIVASADTICKGELVVFDAITFNAGNRPFYQWQLNGQDIGSNESSLKITTLNNGDKIILKVRVDTICPVNANPLSNVVTIHYKPSTPPLSLGPDRKVCFGTAITINPSHSYQQYKWQDGSSANRLVTNSPGLYWLNVVDGCGNASSDTMVLEFFEQTKRLLPNDTAICAYESIEIKTAIPLTFYKWSNFEQSASISIKKPGVYWVTGNDRNGCSASDTIAVASKECIKGFYIPNAFTPNRDSKNDKFRPLIFGNLEKYEFKIFNRWGELVFESRNIAEGWDGRFRGIDQPSNSFVWQCIFQLRDEPVTHKKGTVLLLR